jgi:diaminopimelate epimerase
MKLKILKCHGSSNDFILINEYEKLLFSESERIILSKYLCDRKLLGLGNLGADGILFFQNSENADGKMRMFNPDGSEAEMCGNGLRCIGRFACETLNKKSVLIETLKGISTVSQDKDIHLGVKTYQAELNTISLDKSIINQSLPALSENLKFTAVTMPNPHIVAIVASISDSELDKIGKKANSDKSLFSNGINVNFLQLLDNGDVFVRTYERGVGLTNSCGSGMSASSLVYCLLGHYAFGQKINVYNRGGLVNCKAIKADNYSVYLSGNATFIFSSTLEFEFQDLSKMNHYFGDVFVDEIQNYGRLLESSQY